jgi:hypothetical protein
MGSARRPPTPSGRGSKSREDVDRQEVLSRVLVLKTQIHPGDRIVNWHKPHDPKLLCSGARRIFGGKIAQKPGSKPDGVWWGCGSDWLEWLQSEMPQWLGDYTYRLSLDPSKLLRIGSPSELDVFTEIYGMRESNLDGYYVDWPAVAGKYSGIEICPYIWERRMHRKTHWYYGWDVASGCIWDPCVIRKLERIYE